MKGALCFSLEQTKGKTELNSSFCYFDKVDIASNEKMPNHQNNLKMLYETICCVYRTTPTLSL